MRSKFSRSQVARITGCTSNKIDSWIAKRSFTPEFAHRETHRYSFDDVFIIGLVYLLRNYANMPVKQCFEFARKLNVDDTNDAYFVRIGNTWRMFKDRPLNGVYIYVDIYAYAKHTGEKIEKYFK